VPRSGIGIFSVSAGDTTFNEIYGGGGGSRTPVRKALRAEDYMLSSVQFFSPAALRMSKKRSRLVRWFSLEPYGPKGSSQPAE
jgi:hypothetical protein